MYRFAESLLRSGFAVGVTRYSGSSVRNRADERISVPVQIGGLPWPVVAVVDTGAPFCVVSPELGQELAMGSAERLEARRVMVRGFTYSGFLYRLPVTLQADHGEPLELWCTVFVPDPSDDQPWRDLPAAFLGLQTCLGYFRWAVDPAEDALYFGVDDGTPVL